MSSDAGAFPRGCMKRLSTTMVSSFVLLASGVKFASLFSDTNMLDTTSQFRAFPEV